MNGEQTQIHCINVHQLIIAAAVQAARCWITAGGLRQTYTLLYTCQVYIPARFEQNMRSMRVHSWPGLHVYAEESLHKPVCNISFAEPVVLNPCFETAP
jgi:hypothetical protein